MLTCENATATAYVIALRLYAIDQTRELSVTVNELEFKERHKNEKNISSPNRYIVPDRERNCGSAEGWKRRWRRQMENIDCSTLRGSIVSYSTIMNLGMRLRTLNSLRASCTLTVAFSSFLHDGSLSTAPKPNRSF